jgi:hypothetical protein
MPLYLRVACLVYIAVLLSWALLAPLHETGVFVFITPALNIGCAHLSVLFMLRKRWAWQIQLYMAAASLLVAAAFFPDAETFGALVTIAEVLAALEIAACAAILFSCLQDRSTRSWFFSEAEPIGQVD